MTTLSAIAEMGDSIEHMNNALLELVREVNEKKEKLIREKIRQITGIDVDLKEEQQRRFQRFLYEYKDNTETIYYNDGSVEGLRIITFVKDNTTDPYDIANFKINMQYSYY